jgi:hypothetical protein
LTGALQWVVTIDHFDIITAVIKLSGFRVTPRKGNLTQIKRVYGYLAKMRFATIRVRTNEPDFSVIPDVQYGWSIMFYGESKEILPVDAHERLESDVTLAKYVDANLMHNIVTDISVTGILHFVSKTPTEWYYKKKATVYTATYVSKFVAACTCVEQVIDQYNTLQYLGVPVCNKSYMFGDNKSVVDRSMQLHANLHKQRNMLYFRRVQEAIASGMTDNDYIPGQLNPADILSKHWGYAQIWSLLQTTLC